MSFSLPNSKELKEDIEAIGNNKIQEAKERLNKADKTKISNPNIRVNRANTKTPVRYTKNYITVLCVWTKKRVK